ncbi:MAG TPA: 2-amino-4-hydroxy-6-hydroxymethyldihydropteridine diphosphokinase [Gemmatimonadales bacterium]|nr:2-amino-4-hydroxy-6-hydroxymethyldihydropteridine diphosphokinase [Gemmatimonadales bacterium]
MRARERAWVALGSNLGDREAHLAFARARLARLPESRVLAVSRIEETQALGPGPQDPYLNQMVLLETGLEPGALLAGCRAIEDARGRERRERWGPRTLDLDIVRFGDRTVREPGLVVPHPELPRRDFWQRELAEIDRLVPAHG